jgi:hypothetical protein
MKVTLSAQQQRWLALALLAGVIALVAIFVVGPLWGTAARHEERVAMLRAQASRLEALVSARPLFEAALREASANKGVQSLTFAGADPAVGAADLQGLLNRLLSGAGAVVMSGQAVTDRAGAPAGEIAVQTTFETDIAALVQALHAIGSSRPLLKVEKLTVHEPDGEWVNAVGPQPNVPNKLIVDMVVSAYARRPS